MEFTIVDGGVGAVALISGILAYARGLTRELFAIFGWVAAAGLAFYLAPFVEPLIREAPVIGSFLASSCVISMVTAFVLVVALGLLVLSVFTPLASSLVLDSPLAPVDRTLGFVFGVARGLALVAVAYFLYLNLAGGQEWLPLENAASKVLFDDAVRIVEEQMPAEVPAWFGERIDALMTPCGASIDTTPTPTPTDGAATGTGGGAATTEETQN
ncbi:MAG: CvpA family protein [Pseudomonadota bacterium]